MGRRTRTRAEVEAAAAATPTGENEEYDLSTLYSPGVTRCSIYKVSPLHERGHCGEVMLGPSTPPSSLLEDIRKSHGPGRYQIRPLNDKGEWRPGQRTIEIAPPRQDAPPAPPSAWDVLAPLYGRPPPPAGAVAPAPPPAAGGLPDLQQLALLARLFQPQQPIDLGGLARLMQAQQQPIDMTGLLTALIQQREASTNPVMQFRDLFELVRGEAGGGESSDPSDRMMRMMELMMMMKMAGPMMEGMGMDPREMMAREMMGRRGPPRGYPPPQYQQPRQQPRGYPPPPHQQQPPQYQQQPPPQYQQQPPPQYQQQPPQAAEEDDDDRIPTPSEVVVDLEAVLESLPPEQRAAYMQQLFVGAMNAGIVPPEILQAFGGAPGASPRNGASEEAPTFGGLAQGWPGYNPE